MTERRACLARGFDLADARPALTSFVTFGEHLANASRGRILWHGPYCSCLSAGELLVLQALAQCQCPMAGESPAWMTWRPLLGSGAPHVERHARYWLRALSLEGIHFPTLVELVEGFAPLENLMSFQPASARHH